VGPGSSTGAWSPVITWLASWQLAETNNRTKLASSKLFKAVGFIAAFSSFDF
jgi:hypothetical protein